MVASLRRVRLDRRRGSLIFVASVLRPGREPWSPALVPTRERSDSSFASPSVGVRLPGLPGQFAVHREVFGDASGDEGGAGRVAGTEVAPARFGVTVGTAGDVEPGGGALVLDALGTASISAQDERRWSVPAPVSLAPLAT